MLARKMCTYWTNFAKTGDPNGLDKDGTPMPTWTPYTLESQHPMVFGDEVYMDSEPRPAKEQYLLDVNLAAVEKEKQQ